MPHNYMIVVSFIDEFEHILPNPVSIPSLRHLEVSNDFRIVRKTSFFEPFFSLGK
jgi:hypothetical protein